MNVLVTGAGRVYREMDDSGLQKILPQETELTGLVHSCLHSGIDRTGINIIKGDLLKPDQTRSMHFIGIA